MIKARVEIVDFHRKLEKKRKRGEERQVKGIPKPREKIVSFFFAWGRMMRDVHVEFRVREKKCSSSSEKTLQEIIFIWYK